MPEMHLKGLQERSSVLEKIDEENAYAQNMVSPTHIYGSKKASQLIMMGSATNSSDSCSRSRSREKSVITSEKKSTSQVRDKESSDRALSVRRVGSYLRK